MTDAIARLRGAVRESRSPLAAVLGDDPPPDPRAGESPPAIAAAGPRVADDAAEVELAVAAVHEGYLLHYGEARALALGDPDLELLAGDRLYALGLARLAELGDLVAIGELADVIALGAQAHAAGDADLEAAVWEAGAAVIGWGADDAIAAAKERAREGAPGAAAALRRAAASARSS
ncbi:MAG TPA: hypothetical protein VMY78_17670 [Solirubrobacteraceae bacterium]|nr:hypothetical protein [Solirubrobacteraceae bacterium]